MSKIAKNITYNLFGQSLLIVLGFVAVKFIFKRLGEDALGIIYLAAAINAIFCSMFEVGICSTTIREVSAHHKTDPGYIHDLIRTFSLFYWIFYLGFALAVFFFAPVLVQKWIILKTMDAPTAVHILRVMGMASFLALPKSFYVSLFVGLERMEFNNTIDVLTTGLQQAGTILILTLGGSLFQVVYWYRLSFLAWWRLSRGIAQRWLKEISILLPG